MLIAFNSLLGDFGIVASSFSYGRFADGWVTLKTEDPGVPSCTYITDAEHKLLQLLQIVGVFNSKLGCGQCVIDTKKKSVGNGVGIN